MSNAGEGSSAVKAADDRLPAPASDLAARALGAREGSFDRPVRAIAYGHVFALLALLGIVCSAFQLLQLVLQGGYTTFALYQLARGRYRLTTGRATAAALAPGALAVVFVLLALLVSLASCWLGRGGPAQH